MKEDKSPKKKAPEPKEEKSDDTYTSKDHPVPEAAETGIDEANESPEVQQREAEEGTEQHGKVPISEEFQLQCIDMCKGATKDELDFIRNQVNNRRDELDRIEMESKKEKGGVSMDDYAAVKLG